MIWAISYGSYHMNRIIWKVQVWKWRSSDYDSSILSHKATQEVI